MGEVYSLTVTRFSESATTTHTVVIQALPGSNTISGNQSLPLPGRPAALSGSLPSGGTGSYSYSWESSINQTTWSGLGSGSQNLSPDSINQTTYYRRIVSSGSCPASTSNTVTVSVLSWQKVSLGYYHAVAIRSDGTLWSWGENSYGQLGLGDNTNRTAPVQIGSDSNWVSISAGDEFNMAIRANGTLWSWGHNYSGQLGLGTSGNQNLPVQVGTATNWVKVKAGREFCLGIQSDGTLWSWGNNQMGQLGTGNTQYRNAPGQVGSATDWVDVSAADFHSIAIRSNGTLWSWGDNGNGQLGLGDYANRNTPTQIGSGTNWAKISSRTRQNFAIRTDGTLWAWGEGGYYSLGNGNPNDQTSPVQIGSSSDWFNIIAGYYHTLAIKTNGTLFAWGMNNYGELGDTTNLDKITPIQIGTASNHVWAAAGRWYSAIIRTPGQTICTTGANDIGQLGNGTTVNQNYYTCDIGINPTPPLTLLTSNNSPVCAGQTLSLSANYTPGVTYFWAGPNGFTANTNNINLSNVTTAMSGVYTVTATLNSQSINSTESVTIDSPSVAISPSGTINTCAGNNTLLTASGASSYLWSNSSTSGTISVSSNGTYSVTGTDGNGCSTTSTLVTVQSYPVVSNNAISASQTLCAGLTPAGFTGSAPSGGDGVYAYQWESSGDNSAWAVISGASLQHYSAGLPSGNAYYRRIVSSGDCAASTSVAVSILLYNVIGDNTIGNDQTLCAAGVPANLTGSVPSGGDAAYAYLWQTSANNSTWGNFPGAMQNLTTTYVSATTYYRRVVNSSVCPSHTSGIVTVTLLVGQNDIAASQTIAYNSNPSLIMGLTNLNSPGYAWESSHNNYHWALIPGAGQPNYQPGTLIQHMWYRRKIAGPGCTDTIVSAPIKVTLNMVMDTALTANSNSPICTGSPVYLTAQGPANSVYQWFGPNGCTSAQQNPSFNMAIESLSGVYRVRITKPNGDTASVTVNVEVGSSLGNFQLLFNSPVCTGSTLILSASYLPRVNYSWSGPNGFTSASAVNNFPNAQPSLSGIYTLQATSPGCQSITRTLNVTVNPLLNPNPGSNGPVCAGNILTLTSAPFSGVTYSWTGPNGFSSVLQNPTITNVQTLNSGAYTITLSGLGCPSVTQTHSVLVNASIGNLSVSSNSPVCLGNSLVLSIPAYVNASYTWAGPNGFTGSNSNILNRTNAQTNFSGTYSLTAVIPGCGSVSRVSSVTVLPSITATVGSNSPRCRGQILNLNASTLTGATYSWTGQMALHQPFRIPASAMLRFLSQVCIPLLLVCLVVGAVFLPRMYPSTSRFIARLVE